MDTKTSVEDIRDQAEVWFFRLQSPAVSSDEREAFGEWLVANPEHEQAYFELERIDDLWSSLGTRRDLPEVAAAYCHAETLQESGKKKGWRPLAAVASVVLLVGLSVLGYLGTLPQSQLYKTGLGEQRIVSLEDGSRVMLNTLTSLSVSYRSDQRRIELHRGQANFEVKSEPQRPFVVFSSAGSVIALGTQFDVYQKKNKVRVTLYEGQVQVMPEQIMAGADSARILNPGQAVDFNRQTFLTQVMNIDAGQAKAWQQQRLDFHNTPLRNVIEEVNRYSSRRLELADSRLEGLEISGIFETGDSQAVVAALKTYFKVKVIEGNKLLVIKAPENFER